MIESIENKTQIEYKDTIFTRLWEPITSNVYEEALNIFFPNGAKYNGNLLISKTVLPLNTTEIPTILGAEPYNAVPTGVKIKLNSRNSFRIKFKFLGVLFSEFYISKETKTVIIDNVNTVVSQYIVYYDYNFITGVFTCVFNIPDELIQTPAFSFELINFTPLDRLLFEEFIERPFALNFLTKEPCLDSADICAFLWMAKKGFILKDEKLFSGKSLVEKEFSEVLKVDTISYELPELPQEKYNDLLNSLETGDILVFNEYDLYHCLFILDAKKRYYTECSSYIEYNLGKFYNCKTNPFDFETRCRTLASNSIFYKVRLK
jgi:hypothetical protein